MSICFFRKPEARSSHTTASVTLALPIEKPEVVTVGDPTSEIPACLHMTAWAHEAATELVEEIRDARRVLQALEKKAANLRDRTLHAKVHLGTSNLS